MKCAKFSGETIVLVLLASLTPMANASAEPFLWTPDVFQDSMVLQAHEPIPVFGEAPIHTDVTVSLAGQRKSTVSDGTGAWKVTFDALDYGGPHSMIITTGEDTLKREDVLIGEVWLMSGQSNMEWSFDRHNMTPPVTSIPNLRWLKTAGHKKTKFLPWHPVTPDNVNGMVVMAYFFGKELIDSLDAPVGLIISSDGGTSIHLWCGPEECMMADTAVDAILQRRIVEQVAHTGWHNLYHQHLAPIAGCAIKGVIW
jgi:sialate O-acetylesterase